MTKNNEGWLEFGPASEGRSAGPKTGAETDETGAETDETGAETGAETNETGAETIETNAETGETGAETDENDEKKRREARIRAGFRGTLGNSENGRRNGRNWHRNGRK
jgi:hypothetical protein